jgi:hypothetical protein
MVGTEMDWDSVDMAIIRFVRSDSSSVLMLNSLIILKNQ